LPVGDTPIPDAEIFVCAAGNSLAGVAVATAGVAVAAGVAVKV